MNNREDLKGQAATIIRLGENVLETESEPSHSNPHVNEQKFHDFRISALSFLSRVFGNTSTYYQSFKTEVTQATASRTRRGLGIIKAGQRDIEGDWLETTRGAVTKDVLIDMLKLAKIQKDQSNDKAAVIMMGAILEELLRNLCLKADIRVYNEIQGKAVAKKGLQLTGEAYKKKIYERQENKMIIAWLELYNEAVAGKDENITPSKASQMLTGMQSFLASCSL
ncbi:hypothetical protein [Desulforhopalus sp. IMCC35007]|uniref:hypothetical protein n=1 Tax=Desulforhopalus sp. IMCC35007 TaxID=2569543 RepID=UPI0010ADE2B8|nr:hypothetical protein [Desulforhopalus sp. IMCC35007]TKB08150.1 hypothetical protein FCL48_14310 [Desulforhopalus sp. IMCC35007]